MNKEVVLNFSISESLIKILQENADSHKMDFNSYIEKVVKDKFSEEIKNNPSFKKSINFSNQFYAKMSKK